MPNHAKGKRRVFTPKHRGQAVGHGPRCYDYYVVLDFEATCSDDKNGDFTINGSNQEIIEFPSVLVNAKTLDIVSRVQSYVKPVVQPRLTQFCTNLTGITQETVDGGVSFPAALKAHVKWLIACGLDPGNPRAPGKSFTFVTCGDWDLKSMLPRNMRLLEKITGKRLKLHSCYRQWMNIKTLYWRYFKPGRGRGMVAMLQHAGLSLEGRHHSGIDDCVNTARILIQMLKQRVPCGTTTPWDPRNAGTAETAPAFPPGLTRRLTVKVPATAAAPARASTHPVKPAPHPSFSENEVLKQKRHRIRQAHRLARRFSSAENVEQAFKHAEKNLQRWDSDVIQRLRDYPIKRQERMIRLVPDNWAEAAKKLTVETGETVGVGCPTHTSKFGGGVPFGVPSLEGDQFRRTTRIQAVADLLSDREASFHEEDYKKLLHGGGGGICYSGKHVCVAGSEDLVDEKASFSILPPNNVFQFHGFNYVAPERRREEEGAQTLVRAILKTAQSKGVTHLVLPVAVSPDLPVQNYERFARHVKEEFISNNGIKMVVVSMDRRVPGTQKAYEAMQKILCLKPCKWDGECHIGNPRHWKTHTHFKQIGVRGI